MIIHECIQGSPEWHKSRAGVITASMFAEVRKRVGGLTDQQQQYVAAIKSGLEKKEAATLAGYKSIPTAAGIQQALAGQTPGDYTDAAKNYAFRLAVERISGEPLDEGFETWSMRRGRELEEDCRRLHEAEICTFVELAGFITTDDGLFGCSADALVGEDGGGEYKCFVDPTKLRSIVVEDDWSDIIDQAQGCLWLAHREWWDMCLYCPALKNANKHFLRKRVYRDEEFIFAMEQDLVAFSRLVDECHQQLLKMPEAKAA